MVSLINETSKKDEEFQEYFASLYKLSNEGIRGCSKKGRTFDLLRRTAYTPCVKIFLAITCITLIAVVEAYS